MRLIDADELIDKLNKFESDVHGSAECYSSETEIIEAIEHVGILIDEVPTVEAVPVVHGEWIADERGIYFCSICDSEAYWDTDYGQQLFNHCPYCGADMRKKERK